MKLKEVKLHQATPAKRI